MPAFLASDDEDSEDEGRLLGQRRVRRNYDEPAADDDDIYGGVSRRVRGVGVGAGADASAGARRRCRSSSCRTSGPTLSLSGSRTPARGGPSCASSRASS